MLSTLLRRFSGLVTSVRWMDRGFGWVHVRRVGGDFTHRETSLGES